MLSPMDSKDGTRRKQLKPRAIRVHPAILLRSVLSVLSLAMVKYVKKRPASGLSLGVTYNKNRGNSGH